MDARVQRRVQRYGWDLAVEAYEPLWQAQVAAAHARLLACAAPGPGERVLDVACGTGLVSFAAARAVGPRGAVLGVDLSGRMVAFARHRADVRQVANARFERMGAEKLDLAEASFDVALCALGLMYVPDPAQALREMRRVLRPGGRLAVAVWGERGRCGWSPVLTIVASEVTSEVCPLFFGLGTREALERACAEAGFVAFESHRVSATIGYADEEEACDAAFLGGPVALAWSRFDGAARSKVRRRYLEAIAPWRHGRGYRIPGEFVVACAARPGAHSPVR